MTLGIDVHDSNVMLVALHFNIGDQPREAFIHEWGEQLLDESREKGLDVDSSSFILLALLLQGQCDGRAMYRTVDDIPLEDVACPCGNPNHWLIKYT